MSVLRIFMFGGLRVWLDDEVLPPFPTQKTRSLFAFLVTYRRRVHARPFLAGMFWGDMPEARAQRNLSTTLWRMRRVAPAGYFRVDESTIAFNADAPYWLDTEQFELELALARGEDAEAMAHLQAATQLYGGDFLQGMYDDWLLVVAERLRLAYQQSLQRLFDFYRGDEETLAQALEVGQQLLALDPLREDVHLGMMEVYQRLGRRSAALAQYQHCRQALQKELGIEPLPETQALYRALLAKPKSAPPLAGEHPPGAAVDSPRTPFDDFRQSPWVGRERELALIQQWIQRTQTEGGGMLLVGGVAGVGKTRLAGRAKAMARDAGFITLWGDCPDLLEPPPYQGLSEVLGKGLAALDISTAPPPWLSELAPLLPGLEQRFPSIKDCSPPDPDDAYRRSRLLPAIWRLLQEAVASAPALIVLDDIHWADAATLEALRYLIPRLRSAPILFLLTFRPEELPGRPRLAKTLLSLDASPLSQRLDLAPLSPQETDRLLQRALGLSAPHPILGPLVYNETEGNPFFIGEVLKALVEGKWLFLDADQRWRTVWDRDVPTPLASPPSLPLPRGIRRLVTHRLARVSPTAQSVLAQLAVFGREIDYDILLRFCDAEEETLLAATDELLHRHLLVETEQGLRFSHDKIRQTVYENLSHLRRRRLHRRAGETLAKISPEQVEELAHHFHQAQDHARTLEYALAAGRRAQRLYANQAALTYYDWAIQAGRHLGDAAARRAQITAFEQKGRIYRQLAAWPQAVAAYQAMEAAAGEAGDEARQARAVRLAGWVQGELQGKWELGLREAQRALTIARTAQDAREEAAALRDIGVYHIMLGDYEEALTSLRAALARFSPLQDTRGEASARQYLAVAYHFLGRLDESAQTYEEALSLWRGVGDRLAEIKVLADLGFLLISDGRLTAAGEAFEKADTLQNKIEATTMRTWVQIGLAAVARFQGRYRVCLHILDALTASENLVETDYLRALWTMHRGMARWRLGELDRAYQELERAFTLARASGTPSLMVGVLTEMGRCRRALGDVTVAWSLHQQAHHLAQREGNAPVLAMATSELGLDEALLGRQDGAAARFAAVERQAASLPRWQRAEALLNLTAGRLAQPGSERTLPLAQRALDAANAVGVHSLQLRGVGLLARALAGQGRWAQAEAVLQTGLRVQERGEDDLARALLLTLLARIQLTAGHREAAAVTYETLRVLRAAIAGSLPDADAQRRWRVHHDRIETRVQGPPADGRICVWLPRQDAPSQQAAVVWTVDAGASDDALEAAAGKVALRRARLHRLLEEAAAQRARAPLADLAAALEVSQRTIKRDLAALRREVSQHLPP